MKIGFDILGGDYAPLNCLEGVVMAQKELTNDVTLVLIGDSHEAKKYFKEHGVDESHFEYVHTTDTITMGASPISAGLRPSTICAGGCSGWEEVIPAAIDAIIAGILLYLIRHIEKKTQELVFESLRAISTTRL